MNSTRITDVQGSYSTEERTFLFSVSLLYKLIRRDIEGRFFGSVLGFYWTIINPIVLMIVYTVVFTVIFKSPFSSEEEWWSYPLLLFCGLLPWLGMQEAVARSTTILIEQTNLLKKTTIRPLILLLSVIFSSLVMQCISFSIFLIALLVLGEVPSVSWLLLLPLFLIQYLFVIGVGLIVSTMNVLFRDTQHFVGIILSIMFFASPIIYPTSMVPENWRLLFHMNPVALFIDIYRSILITGGYGPAHYWIAGTAVSIFMVSAGLWIFKKVELDFVDYL